MRLKLPTTAIATVSALALGACGESTGPNGGGGGQPAPAPTRVDIAVESRYIRIHGSCDPDDLLGNPTNGEFHYEVTLEGPGRTVTHGTTNYNSVTASSVSRGAGSNIDFGNRTLTFTNVELGALVRVWLRLVEWDGPVRDSRMNNELGRVTAETGSVQDYTDTVSIGSGDCHGELFFDVRIRER